MYIANNFLWLYTTTAWHLTPYNAFAEEFLVDANIEYKHTIEPWVAGRVKALLHNSGYKEEVGIWEVSCFLVAFQGGLSCELSYLNQKDPFFESSYLG